MLDEVLLIIGKLLPILDILCEIDFFGGPKGSLLILVHLPDVTVLNREQYEAVGVFLKKGLVEFTLALGNKLGVSL